MNPVRKQICNILTLDGRNRAAVFLFRLVLYLAKKERGRAMANRIDCESTNRNLANLV